jgi:hypothetical protein
LVNSAGWASGRPQGEPLKSNNILVSDNSFISGDGSATQSIFVRNELADQSTERKDQYYRNITTEDNLIYNGHSFGITVGQTNGLTTNSAIQYRVSWLDLNFPDSLTRQIKLQKS